MKIQFFSRKQGFTLIELVVVILVLAIIASIGIPQFISVKSEARTATVEGMRGAINGAVLLARAKHRISGQSSPVSMDGTSVDVTSSGIPCANSAGIGSALFAADGFTLGTTTGTACDGSATVTYQPSDGGSATCQVLFNENGSATVTTTGC